MAETDGVLIIGIELDDGTVRKAQIKADDFANAVSKGVGDKISSGIDKSFTGIATQLTFIAKIATSAFNTVSDVIGKSIEEASQAESALNSLQIALRNIGADPESASGIAKVASDLQNLGTVSDDAVISAAQSLVSIGNLSGKALEDATRASVDLAAGLKIDLNSAFDLVAKSAAGNTSALARYRLTVDENLPQSEKFAATLNLINQRFGGFDAAKANTFEGAISKLSIAFNDVYESIGRFITQDKTIIAIINVVTKAIAEVGGAIDNAFKSKSNVVGDFVKGFLKDGLTIVTVLGNSFQFLASLVSTVFGIIRTGIFNAIAGFQYMKVAIQEVLNTVGLVSDETLATTKRNADVQKEAVIESAKAAFDSLKQTVSGGVDIPLLKAVEDLIQKMINAADNAGPVGKKIKEGLGKPLEEIASDTKQIGAVVDKFLKSTISGGIQSLGATLVQGSKAFGQFTKNVLGLFGDLLIGVGEAILFTGKAIEALKTSIIGVFGGSAIAAGIALIALGGALKAASGGGAGGSAATGVPTTEVGPGTTNTIGTEKPDLISRNAQTAVTVNVQGNVLDRRESGLEIARVLQEYFDTNDGILAKA